MDKELEDLKTMYGATTPTIPEGFKFSVGKSNEALRRLKFFQLKTMVVFVLTAAAIIGIDVINSTAIETSRAGFWILLGCALYYAATRYYLYQKLNAVDASLPVLAAVAALQKYERLNRFFHTWGELLYVAALSVGVYLYLQPVLVHTASGQYLHGAKWIGIAYLLWVAYYSFVVKQRRWKKETAMLDKYIAQLQAPHTDQ